MDDGTDDGAGRAALRPRLELLPRADGRTALFFPTAKTYAFTEGSAYNDLSPRGGVAIDVFGNGKTSVKFNVGRYLEAAQNGGFFITNNPTGRLSTTSARTWGDADLDFVPDCNLLDQNANGECGVGNRNFGTEVVSSTLDPSLVTGWGVRTGDWQWGAAVQQQLLPRVSAEVTFQRRWLMNFAATDNRNLAPSDYDAFAVIIPTDSRLPDGGGGTLPGLYNITAAANTRLTDNFVTLAERIGEQTQSTDSVSLNVTARPRGGLTLQGGFNYARTASDACAIHNALPEYTVLGGIIGTTNPWCATTVSLFRTTALGSYIVPKVDVQVGFTLRSDQGASLNANYTTTLGQHHARPSVRRREHDDHGQPGRAGHALRRPRQPVRPAHRQGAPASAAPRPTLAWTSSTCSTPARC